MPSQSPFNCILSLSLILCLIIPNYKSTCSALVTAKSKYPPVERPLPVSDARDPDRYTPIVSDADGNPVDFLTGMSKRGWKMAQETHKMILAAAAKACNTSGDGAFACYDKQRLFTESIWFSLNRDYLAQGTKPEDIWNSDIYEDRGQILIAKVLDKMIDAITDSEDDSYVAYHTLAEHIAYDIHYRLEKGHFHGRPPTKIGLNAFWPSSYARIFMGEFFLGSDFTEERRESYAYAIFFINSMNWHYLNLYELGCKKPPRRDLDERK